MYNDIYYYIISFLDGYERENMRLVCKDFYHFNFKSDYTNPILNREVLLIANTPINMFKLGMYGYLDIIYALYRNHKEYSLHYAILGACYAGNTHIATQIHNSHQIAVRGGIHMINELSKIDLSDIILVSYYATSIQALYHLHGYRYNDNKLLHVMRYGTKEDLDTLLNVGHYDIDGEMEDACREGNIHLVKYLIYKGASLRNDLLEYAVESGNISLIEYLIDSGLEFTTVDILSIKNYNVIKYLMQQSLLNPNDCLLDACEDKDTELMQLSIEFGANNWDAALFRLLDSDDITDCLNIILYESGDHFPNIFRELYEAGHDIMLIYLLENNISTYEEAMTIAEYIDDDNLSSYIQSKL